MNHIRNNPGTGSTWPTQSSHNTKLSIFNHQQSLLTQYSIFFKVTLGMARPTTPKTHRRIKSKKKRLHIRTNYSSHNMPYACRLISTNIPVSENRINQYL